MYIFTNCFSLYYNNKKKNTLIKNYYKSTYFLKKNKYIFLFSFYNINIKDEITLFFYFFITNKLLLDQINLNQLFSIHIMLLINFLLK